MTILTEVAFKAANLIMSIGVCTHIGTTSSTYGNMGTVQRSLVYIGVTNVREVVPGPSRDNSVVNSFLSLGAFTLNGRAYHTNFDIISGSSLDVTKTYLDKISPYVAYVEGPNEVNHVPITFKTAKGVTLTGAAAADAFQTALYATIRADAALRHARVMTFSLAPGLSYAGYGNVAASADFASVHAYGQYGIPPHWFLQPEITAVTLAPGKPYIVTETGDYTMPDHGTGVNEDVQAKLILDTLLDNFKAGVKQTYLYQLLDPYADPANRDWEDHFGLFHINGTPKIAATALHNLTTILADTDAAATSFTTRPLSVGFAGLPGAGYQFVMQKANGVYEIALWQEPWIWDNRTNTEINYTPAATTITLGRFYPTVNVYNPLTSSAPVKTYHNASAVPVSLGTGAMIVEVKPTL